MVAMSSVLGAAVAARAPSSSSPMPPQQRRLGLDRPERLLAADLGAVSRVSIVAARLAGPTYAPPIGSRWARRPQLVQPAEVAQEQVGLAPPDGLQPPTATQAWTTTSRSG